MQVFCPTPKSVSLAIDCSCVQTYRLGHADHISTLKAFRDCSTLDIGRGDIAEREECSLEPRMELDGRPSG